MSAGRKVRMVEVEVFYATLEVLREHFEEKIAVELAGVAMFAIRDRLNATAESSGSTGVESSL